MTRRALITGITGQDGSYLAERLHGAGWEVHGLVRREQPPEESPIPVWASAHVGDLLDPESLTRAVDAAEPDAIFHLAGVTSVARSWEDPEGTARSTGLAAATLMDAAWRRTRAGHDVRFIQASSAEIFGAAPAPQSEATALAPTSPYGAAKAYAHHLVGVYRLRGLAASSAILFNHESPRRPPAFVTRKITRGAARIAAGLESRLTLGNLEARRDWGWAPDYMAALEILAEVEPTDVVIATGVAHTVEDFVAEAFRASGLGDWREYVDQDPALMRPADATIQLGDPSRAAELLGWRATTTFTEIVQRMVEHDRRILAG